MELMALSQALQGGGMDGQGEVAKASEAEDEGEDVKGDWSDLPIAEQGVWREIR